MVASVVPLRRPPEQFVSVPGELTETSLVLRDGLSFEEWQEAGRVLQRVERSVRWWIGDWLAYGERVYGETYAQAIEATGHKVQDLMNMVYVSTAVEFSRRRENLTWSHHAEVASLDPSAQDAWLAKAEVEELSTRDLREQIATAKQTAARNVLPQPGKCSKCGRKCMSCEADIERERECAVPRVEAGDRIRIYDDANERVEDHEVVRVSTIGTLYTRKSGEGGIKSLTMRTIRHVGIRIERLSPQESA